MSDPVKQVYTILRQPNPKQKQINKLTRLYRYVLEWPRSSFYLFVLRWFPELRFGIPIKLQNSYNTQALYAAMDSKQLSNIIQRLEAIERRNKKKGVTK